MRRPEHAFVFLASLSMMAAACGPAAASPTLALAQPSATEPAATETQPPSSTPVPSDTPTPEPTATLSGPWLTPLYGEVDCQFGPDVLYDRVGTLAMGGGAGILGVSRDGNWYQVPNPEAPSQMCWFGKAVVTVNGDLGGVPRVDAPMGSVTRVDLTLPSSFIGFEACDGPNFLLVFGEISTNGPSTVTYHYEVHGQIEVIGASVTLHFDKAGDHGDEVSYGPPLPSNVEPYVLEDVACGDYAVRIVVTDPDPMELERQFTIPLVCETQFC